MLAKILLLATLAAIGAQALKCKRQAIDKQHLDMGNYHGPVTIPIDLGDAYECEANLDRCATFGPTDITKVMKWDGGKILTPLWLLGTAGTVEGTTCVSQKDCANMSALQGDNGCKTKQNCCCNSDNCADYLNSALSLPLLTSLATILAMVVLKN